MASSWAKRSSSRRQTGMGGRGRDSSGAHDSIALRFISMLIRGYLQGVASLLRERRASLARRQHMLAQDVADAPPRQGLAAQVDEDRTRRPWIDVAFLEERPQEGCRLRPQRQEPLLLSLAPDADLERRIQLEVTGTHAQELGHTCAGLVPEAQQGVVAAAGGGRAIHRLEERCQLIALEVVDFRAWRVFERDPKDPLTLGEARRISRPDESEEDVQSREPNIARGDRVLALTLEVVEEGEHDLRGEISESEIRNGFSAVLADEREEQLEPVAVAHRGVGTDLPLGAKVIVKEGMEVSAELVTGAHGSPPRGRRARRRRPRSENSLRQGSPAWT